ncbi:solute carrier family 66 member 3 [Arctopsyche grandis]|uniref:solute carrier family 66 member 3 n=1 Tax=Arctopsyche grandis TaxID=121162 RepID=UPI00406D85AD
MGTQPVQLFADSLSLITIASCLVLKVPQIMKVKELKSAAGVNLQGLLLELFSYSTTFLYNYCNSYSLLSYMEYPIILLQEIVLIYYVLLYSKKIEKFSTQMYGLVYFGIMALFLVDILSPKILSFLLPFTTPISASSKMIFLYEIYHTKNSEAVSLLTWLLSAFTNLTRIFTVAVDSGDINLLANFTISTALSVSILLSAWFYKKRRYAD